jgi:hypothetical protein
MEGAFAFARGDRDQAASNAAFVASSIAGDAATIAARAMNAARSASRMRLAR